MNAYVTPSNDINSTHVTPAHVTPAYVTPAHVTPAHVTSAYVTPAHVTSAHVTSAYVTPAHVTPAYVTPAHVTPAHVTSAHVTPAHVTPAHVTSAHVTPAHVTSAHITPAHLSHAHSTTWSGSRPTNASNSTYRHRTPLRSVAGGSYPNVGSGSSTSKGGGASGGSGYGERLVRVVPESALSSAQWATRSDSFSKKSGGHHTLSSLHTSASTPSFLQLKSHNQLSSTLSSGSSASVTGTNRSSSALVNLKGLGASSASFINNCITPVNHQGERGLTAAHTPSLLPTFASKHTPSPTLDTFSSDSRHMPPVSSATTNNCANLPSHDLTSDDPELGGQSVDEAVSQVIMSLSWSQGKLGAAFYNITTSQVYVVEDKVEAAPDFWVLRTLFREQLPRMVVVGGRQDHRLFTVLRELCGIPHTPLVNTDTPQDGREGDDGKGGRRREARSPSMSLSSSSSCTIRILPMADFKYELCVRRVLSLALPGEPEEMTEEERELYMRGKVNTDLISMTRALGAMLRFLDKHGIELVGAMEITSVLGLHIYIMEEIAQLDEATASALRLFSEDQHPAAFKSGKSSASKEGLSVYALLSRTACPMASHTLRRLLLRPVVDMEVLHARYAAVGWGVNPANLETLRQLHSCLRHITNVTHTVGRLQRGQLSVRDWKVLYKSLFNAILVGEICQGQDQSIPIFKQTGEGVTEGLYRATFLIQRIMDMDQSEREARFVVKPGVDSELDDKKRRFSGLGEVMRRVAVLELSHLPEEVETCCIIYLPHVGYLLAFPPPPVPPSQTSPETQDEPAHYQLPGLEFMFETADMAFYKSQTCCELDQELGDIQVEIANHETRIMMRLVDVLLQQTQPFLTLITHILMLDCLLSFSVVARECGWVQPELTRSPVLEVRDGRHPLYELCTPTFVSNPIVSGGSHPSITLITGPNASGKTVYLKQVGVLVVLAQIGSWVPASYARLRPVDAIIAVTQTTPSVTSHLSTFMLDLTRMCTAVSGATRHSLVIIDEFGASTYENDGAALLTACLDHWGAMVRGNRELEGMREIQEQAMSRRLGIDHSDSMHEDIDSEICSQPETEEDSMHNRRKKHRSRREEKRNQPHLHAKERDERETLDPEIEGDSSRQQNSNRQERTGEAEGTERRDIHEQREPQAGSSSGDRRKKKEEAKEAGRAPHVFVSTHLLQVFDHLLYPDTVRCLVLEGVVEDEGGQVVPLYQVAEGRATASYATAVAALAGVPQHVVTRASQVCECIRTGQLPPRWSLLEDEGETRKCRAVVSILLSHLSSQQPLLTILQEIKKYSASSTPLLSPDQYSSPLFRRKERMDVDDERVNELNEERLEKLLQQVEGDSDISRTFQYIFQDILQDTAGEQLQEDGALQQRLCEISQSDFSTEGNPTNVHQYNGTTEDIPLMSPRICEEPTQEFIDVPQLMVINASQPMNIVQDKSINSSQNPYIPQTMSHASEDVPQNVCHNTLPADNAKRSLKINVVEGRPSVTQITDSSDNDQHSNEVLHLPADESRLKGGVDIHHRIVQLSHPNITQQHRSDNLLQEPDTLLCTQTPQEQEVLPISHENKNFSPDLEGSVGSHVSAVPLAFSSAVLVNPAPPVESPPMTAPKFSPLHSIPPKSLLTASPKDYHPQTTSSILTTPVDSIFPTASTSLSAIIPDIKIVKVKSKRKKDHILRAAAKVFKAFGEPQRKEKPMSLVPYSPTSSITSSPPISLPVHKIAAKNDYDTMQKLNVFDKYNQRMTVSQNYEENDKDGCQNCDYKKADLGKDSFSCNQEKREEEPQLSQKQSKVRSEDQNSNIFASQTSNLRLRLDSYDDLEECISLSHGLDDSHSKDSKENSSNSSDDELKHSSLESSCVSDKSVLSCVSEKSAHLVRQYARRFRAQSSLSREHVPVKLPK
ncbi:hypothetical protein Pcinc_022449 [Petrolisthes cinctipes]|uniref:DNA mismatch repair proteins mutS family domain-containing protein n=1 Tax=Petrolisthes cinctipes TaxID=88211 RepID=A0AAE1FEQ5_PETCI|nr:hypothetical protein Pcinc_022449 [Petrolisthes cinctipes]